MSLEVCFLFLTVYAKQVYLFRLINQSFLVALETQTPSDSVTQRERKIFFSVFICFFLPIITLSAQPAQPQAAPFAIRDT